METKWLLDFVSLANTGNFSRSAADRNVSQSGFSRRIRSLENWLGTELFDRTTHPVSLTDSGIRFLKPAKNMIRLARRIQDDFAKYPESEREVLRFSSATNLAISFLPQWLAELRTSLAPFDAKVQTDISGIHDHFETLRSQQTDFLLHYGHGVDMLAMDASKFEHTVVATDVLVPVAHHTAVKNREDYLLQCGTGALVPYVSPWRTSSIANLIAERIAEADPSPRLDTVVESSIVGCTKGFVSEGVGIAWLPSSAIEKELASGEFVRAADPGFDIPLSIELYRSTNSSRRFAARFWEFIQMRPAMAVGD